MSMKEEARNKVSNFFSGSQRPSEKEIGERAREIAAVTGISYDEAHKRLKAYWAMQGREPVPVWIYGPGDSDFDEDQGYAEVLSDSGKPCKGFAWKDEESGELKLATKDELKAFRKENPDYKFN